MLSRSPRSHASEAAETAFNLSHFLQKNNVSKKYMEKQQQSMAETSLEKMINQITLTRYPSATWTYLAAVIAQCGKYINPFMLHAIELPVNVSKDLSNKCKRLRTIAESKKNDLVTSFDHLQNFQ